MNVPFLPLRRLAALAALALSLPGLAAAAPAVPRADADAPTTGTSLATPAPPTDGGPLALPLSRLLGGDAPVRLTGVESHLDVTLPVPAMARPEDLVLVIEGTVSTALTADSQLVVELDDHVVHQARLTGTRARLHEEVALPPALLAPGFRHLRLRLVQHYADRCEFPMAPQLWTVIDTAASGLRGRMVARDAPARLDRLDAWLDKAAWTPHPRVPVFNAGAAQPSAAMLSALSLVAQGIGQRYDYVPVTVSQAPLPGDLAAVAAAVPDDAPGAIVLGRFDTLGALLAGSDVPTGQGPVALIRPLPGAPGRFLLVLAAPTDEGLHTPAAAFAMQRFPWPDRAWATMRDLQLPPLGSVTGAAASLKPGTGAYPLRALGFRTTTYEGTSPTPLRLQFWNNAWQGRVQLRLHATWGAGMAPQSALNVRANGALQGSISLTPPTGGAYENYAVTLPAGALHPGWNTLELQPVLVPQDSGGDCRPFFPGNLAVTIHDDSTLQAFGGSALRRPDLGLLAHDGRALPDVPVGVGMAVQLTDADPRTVSAGLTLMAKLTQVFKGPMLRTEFRVGASPDAVNRLWVGPMSRLPADVRSASGLDAQGELAVPVPLIQSATVPVLEGGEVVQALRTPLESGGAEPVTLAARTRVPAAPPGHAAAATARMDGRAVTVFTATSEDDLAAGMARLVDYGPWSQLRGTLALWRTDEGALRTLDEDDAPFVAYSLRGGVGLWISQYPWWALAGVVLAMAVAVWLARRALAFRRQRYLPTSPAQRRDDGPRR